jgi:hypothetical protein
VAEGAKSDARSQLIIHAESDGMRFRCDGWKMTVCGGTTCVGKENPMVLKRERNSLRAIHDSLRSTRCDFENALRVRDYPFSAERPGNRGLSIAAEIILEVL